MEDVQIVTVNQKDLENPFGERSGNLTSHLIKHPDLISKGAKFVQAQLQIFDKRHQEASTSLYVDLVFEDENGIYLVEVKDDWRTSEVEKGKKQVLEYYRTFQEYLKIKRVSPTKNPVPVVARLAE